MPPVSSAASAVAQPAADPPAADGPETDFPVAPAGAVSPKKKAGPSNSPRFIDDRYGPGELGPRILSHESEIVAVAPQRMDLYLRDASLRDDLPPSVAAARAAASGQGEKPQTLTAADDGADGRVPRQGRDGPDEGRAGGRRTPRAVEAEARAARPVRVWEVREPRAARPASPLSPAEVDARAYLAQLGVRSVYDLSPGSRRLALPGGLRLPRHVWRSGSAGAFGNGASAAYTPQDWEEMIREAGRLFGLDPRFIAAVIKVESNFDHRAVSSKGAQGAMQIMPDTQAQLGLENPFDVRANIHAGCAFLRELLLQYGSTELALAAYNAGPGAVDRHGGIPPYAETRNYVRRVMALWQGEATQAADSAAGKHVGQDGRQEVSPPHAPARHHSKRTKKARRKKSGKQADGR